MSTVCGVPDGGRARPPRGRATLSPCSFAALWIALAGVVEPAFAETAEPRPASLNRPLAALNGPLAALDRPLAAPAPDTAPTDAPHPLIARRITESNFETHHVGGPDAEAGIDDWFLSNGTICAALTDPSHESQTTPRGGVLVDLGHCGRDDDQWAVLQPMLNLSQSLVVPIAEVHAETTDDTATIETRALYAGIDLRMKYSVNRTTPNALEIAVRAQRVEPGDRLFSVGQIILHPSGQTPVFSLSRLDLDRSAGFRYPETDRHSILSLLGALIPTDVFVLVGAEGFPPISYGIERGDAVVRSSSTETEGITPPALDAPSPPRSTTTTPHPPHPADDALASFSVSGKHFSATNTLTSPLWFGGANDHPGLFQLGQIPFMDLSDGQVLHASYRIHVHDRAEVAPTTDLVWSDAPRLTGHVNDASAVIHFARESGAPASQLRPDAQGDFSLRLPPGNYVARVAASGDRHQTVSFSVEPDRPEQSLPPIVLAPTSGVRLPSDFTGRLFFFPAEGGPAVVFGKNRLGQQMGSQSVPSGIEAPFVVLAESPSDPNRVPLRPGRYRVIALRGPEYAQKTLEIEVSPGVDTPLEISPLERIRPTSGWVAADLHVHSGPSFDSAVPQERQVAAFVASGAEVLVATEHDRVVDPQPAIARAGLDAALVPITGVEVTSSYRGGDSPHATGHLNAFPFAPEPKATRGGAPTMEGRRLRDVLHDIAQRPGGPFVQMNHPRPGNWTGEGDEFFSHLGVVGEPYDPTRPLDAPPNAALINPSPEHGGRDLDFDGVELLNSGSLLRYRRVRADWFSLLLQGKRLIGTANSDSHRLGTLVGYPRTYVRVPADTLASVDTEVFMDSLRAGRAWGSTGPLLEVALDEAGLGELHAGETGRLKVKVDAAPWVPIREWRAYVNGELVHRAAIAAGETAELPLAFAADGFVTVEVEGDATGVYAEVLPGFVPFAYTNPIFVDADQDGEYVAPGLPAVLPPTLTSPDTPLPPLTRELP